ncbi:response regulator transcription factor [Mesorhizobium sp. M1B.F.Ca.ET.045.04.1.1]|uniref:winged helix-turn-helix domain-containing protein n=1 Tax=Mesorhizobium sp. M1B.F.Ca.ET.045.04.1.1 TaxID=2493673 RepID=UPI000F75B835|nr:response regulator transcription factor [Mesorhizobium sp. M1B.F.Ca.ET.045.04.1.1]AZO28755.1 response regulator transcription factor [Mesorhizobium sp. M1B.F.Ca.ET.045.04.1.1]
MKPLVAIYTQDPQFYLMLGHILEVDGFSVSLAASVEETFELAAEKSIRAVVLDCRPGNLLVEEAARLKQDPRTSTLAYIALVPPGAGQHHIALLKSGIDECLAAPFAPARLIDYLHSRLAISRSPGSVKAKSLAYGEVEMNIDTYRIRCGGRQVSLGPIEFKLLRHMLEHPEKVIGRNELIAAGWPSKDNVSARTVDVHISQLRKLLHQNCASAFILTVRLAGYALRKRRGEHPGQRLAGGR